MIDQKFRSIIDERAPRAPARGLCEG